MQCKLAFGLGNGLANLFRYVKGRPGQPRQSDRSRDVADSVGMIMKNMGSENWNHEEGANMMRIKDGAIWERTHVPCIFPSLIPLYE